MDSIAALHRAFTRRELSPVEVLDQTLAELHAREPELNAFVSVLEEEARAQAERAERAFADGESTSPLAGVPISIKDIMDVEGRPTTAGSAILRDAPPAQADAAVVARLRRAGAVLFAKANLLEFAYGFPHPDYGQSNNPVDPSRTAGGSSGGPAAAVAAGIGAGSVVTDTGGSARLPAAFCGVVGVRPTFGSLPMGGVLGLAPSLDTVGVVARTPADATALLGAMGGLPQAPGTGDDPTATAIGVVTDLLGEPLSPQVERGFGRALDALRSMGAAVRDVRLRGAPEAAADAATVMLAEAAHLHAQWFPTRAAEYAPGTRANLERGSRITSAELDAARDRLAGWRRAVDAALEEVDALACPTIGFTAPQREPDFADGGLDYILRTMPFAAAGTPAVSVPAPRVDGTLPVGVMLVGRRGGDRALLALAEAYERLTPTPARARPGHRL